MSIGRQKSNRRIRWCRLSLSTDCVIAVLTAAKLACQNVKCVKFIQGEAKNQLRWEKELLSNDYLFLYEIFCDVIRKV